MQEEALLGEMSKQYILISNFVTKLMFLLIKKEHER